MARALPAESMAPLAYGLAISSMTKALNINQRVNLDTESRAIIYQGASVNQLAEIFGMKTPDVARKLGDLRPVGEGRQGNPLYKVDEAAARLIKIPVSADMIHRHLRRMNPKDLPPMLNKLFWEGLAARRRYEEQAGELWASADVGLVTSAAFQSLRMSLLLIPDVLRDETDLSERQFSIVQGIVDNALEEARSALVTDLRKSSEPRSRPDAEEGPL